MALKLRRAEERFIPQSTRAASFKRLLGGWLVSDRRWIACPERRFKELLMRRDSVTHFLGPTVDQPGHHKPATSVALIRVCDGEKASHFVLRAAAGFEESQPLASCLQTS